MTTRLASAILVSTLIFRPGTTDEAQSIAPPAGVVERQFRDCGVRLRRFEALVLKRLDEVKPPGPTASDLAKTRAQETALVRAEGVHQVARMNVELAELDIQTYERAEFPQEQAVVLADIAQAEGALRSAEESLKESEQMGARLKEIPPKDQPADPLREYRDYLFKRFLKSDEFALKRAEIDLDIAKTRQKVLVEYTKPKRVKELQSALERAKADDLARRADYLIEKEKKALSQDQRPQGLTSGETKALSQLDQALQIWKKIVAGRAEIKGGVAAGQDDIKVHLASFTKAIEEAERSWEDGQDVRLDAQDAEVEGRIRKVLGTKPPG